MNIELGSTKVFDQYGFNMIDRAMDLYLVKIVNEVRQQFKMKSCLYTSIIKFNTN